ncbi:multiple resistance and pH regulation protein F [Caldichromatium japonicum]|uniref:Multiple resistance and pH regulation protein F n=1 Tax=Caldichromatium japonicum TaxID=2699430 RepID=A0A6G7VBB0_9GAMM|nr:monovalent cation/H+ antiporter complex subunit F [Caldichromatium japonicum]QIK37349.1 multiple resistance and pH regulation protein F [Caldichromatium japonicum]
MPLAELNLAIALMLLATISVGLIRVVLGPTPADRLLAAQLLGTSGIGVLVVLSSVIQVPALIDVALVFALLAAVTTIAFTRKHP